MHYTCSTTLDISILLDRSIGRSMAFLPIVFVRDPLNWRQLWIAVNKQNIILSYLVFF